VGDWVIFSDRFSAGGATGDTCYLDTVQNMYSGNWRPWMIEYPRYIGVFMVFVQKKRGKKDGQQAYTRHKRKQSKASKQAASSAT
jgi:hypothetical protein